MTDVALLAATHEHGNAVRRVLLEKGIRFAFHPKNENAVPTRYAHIDLDKHPLILVDHQLVVFNRKIMLEFLDERYPAPPLMPIDPVARAQARQAIMQLYTDWDARLRRYTATPDDDVVRREMFDDLLALNHALQHRPFLLGGDISLVDMVLHEALDKITALHPSLVTSMPNLRAYYSRLNSRPSARAYAARFNHHPPANFQVIA